jgi:hypothetical protein
MKQKINEKFAKKKKSKHSCEARYLWQMTRSPVKGETEVVGCGFVYIYCKEKGDNFSKSLK